MTLRTAGALLSCCLLLLNDSLPAAEPPAARAALQRPALRVQQGQYFRWSAPAGWTSRETSNGVDLLAPDGKTFVSSALLAGAFGTTTPRQFLELMVRQVNPSLHVLNARALPQQPAIMGPWQSEEYELSGTFQGISVRLSATVGVSSAYGRYWATMTLCQSPSGMWARDRTWLPAIAGSIAVTNPRQVAGADRVMLPRNNPLDNSGLIESWRQKGLSDDRISQARQEATMGYERVQDSEGRNYDMPYEAFDASAGGYRNPERPTELLQKTPVGE